MTNACHAQPTPRRGPKNAPLPPAALIALPIVAILIAAVLWSFFAARSQSNANARAIAETRTGIVAGMSRATLYRWLRTRGLVAFNPAYAAWSKTSLGVWYRSDNGAWPQADEQRPTQVMSRPLNPAHPEVDVKLSSAPHGGCGMATIEQIMFDRFERVKHIAYSAPYWTCQ